MWPPAATKNTTAIDTYAHELKTNQQNSLKSTNLIFHLQKTSVPLEGERQWLYFVTAEVRSEETEECMVMFRVLLT